MIGIHMIIPTGTGNNTLGDQTMPIKKRYLVLYFFIIFVLLISSSCKLTVNDDHDNPEEGILKIVNNTEFTVWLSIEGESEYNLESGEYVEYFWDLDDGESIQINIEYHVPGSDVVFTSVNVEAGLLTTFNISFQTGEIHLRNNTSFEIWYKIDEGTMQTLVPGGYEVISYELLTGETIWVDLEYGSNGGGESISTTVAVEAGYVNVFTIEQVNGELEIWNESNRDTWYSLDGGAQKTLHSGKTDEWIYELLVYDQVFTDIDYSGYHVFSNFTSTTITGGYTTYFNIEPDGGGIKIENDMDYTDITEIYLSPCDDPSWGSNDLSGLLYAGCHAFWTVSPGCWDILAVDENEAEYTSFNNTIYIDETSKFFIDGWKKSTKRHQNKKSKEYYPDSITKDKIEFKQPE